MLDQDCLFCKIIRGEIPSSKVYEDEEIYIFRDIAPQAKLHYLVVLKDHFAEASLMSEEQAETLGRAIRKIGLMKVELGLEGGYRIAVNTGDDACQSVHHLHVHVLGGEELSESMC